MSEQSAAAQQRGRAVERYSRPPSGVTRATAKAAVATGARGYGPDPELSRDNVQDASLLAVALAVTPVTVYVCNLSAALVCVGELTGRARERHSVSYDLARERCISIAMRLSLRRSTAARRLREARMAAQKQMHSAILWTIRSDSWRKALSCARHLHRGAAATRADHRGAFRRGSWR